MKHIIEEYDFTVDFTSIIDSYLDTENFAVIDIETSGLSPVYSSVILVGILIYSDNRITLHQLFANTPDEEPEILKEAASLIFDVGYVVTYNGRMFDMPFLNKRASKHNILFPNPFNLDLFIILKYYSQLPDILPRMNQKTLEEYAGISKMRQDRITGGESVDLYTRYIETMDKDLERRILLHNSDDVLQLYRLMTLLRNADIHKAFFKTGFPIIGGRLTKVEVKNGDLTVKGISNNPADYIAFPSIDSPYNFQMTKKEGSFELILPCETKGKDIFLDISTLFSNDQKEFLSRFPGYVSDYIILKESGEINYMESNHIARYFAEKALEKAL